MCQRRCEGEIVRCKWPPPFWTSRKGKSALTFRKNTIFLIWIIFILQTYRVSDHSPFSSKSGKSFGVGDPPKLLAPLALKDSLPYNRPHLSKNLGHAYVYLSSFSNNQACEWSYRRNLKFGVQSQCLHGQQLKVGFFFSGHV